MMRPNHHEVGGAGGADGRRSIVLDGRPVKRSFTIARHATSISLEPAFWEAFKAAAKARDIAMSKLVAEIDGMRGADTNLSSAVRVWILTDLQHRRIPDSG